MLISTYKPFIIADEQLIRLPAPCPAMLMHSECLSITRRRCSRIHSCRSRDWSKINFLFFLFPIYICIYAQPRAKWYIPRDKRGLASFRTSRVKTLATVTRRKFTQETQGTYVYTRSCNKVGAVGVIARVPRYGKTKKRHTLITNSREQWSIVILFNGSTR